jgi:NAD(P)-dependent dehydrogenase (short-subunit alcohol dehydrogenase family)
MAEVDGRFGGRVALVTGAGKGIGRAAAIAFAAEGGAVGALDFDGDAVKETVAHIEESGGRAIAIHGDVRKGADAERAVAGTAEAFGGPDVLVSNAGVVRYAATDRLTEEDWDLQIDTNLKGPWLMAKHAIPRIRERGGGAIIQTASVQAFASQKDVVAYTASKGGVVAMTRTMALDLADDNITVNCIIPGSVRTPMLHDAAEYWEPEDPRGALEKWGKQHPIGRLIEPEDVANLILFLASDHARAMTGGAYFVEGGLLSRLGV